MSRRYYMLMSTRQDHLWPFIDYAARYLASPIAVTCDPVKLNEGPGFHFVAIQCESSEAMGWPQIEGSMFG